MLTIGQKVRITALVMITVCAVLLSCYMISEASAQNSYVQVKAESDGGSFNFTGSGAYCNWNIDLYGFDLANVDLTNQWDRASSTVKYEEIGDGEIQVKVTEYKPGDEMYYFRWEKLPINGDGVYSPGGGRNVELVNSPNVTGFIEYPERDRKAVFLFDTRHSHADLRVIVHNGELLENATVTLINGNQKVQWTDENGEAKFTPGTGTYHMIIEHENFSAMLVDDLFLEASKSYLIRVNMTDCLTSSGVAVCGPDADDLIVYYKNKTIPMETISPQGYVNYFAERLMTCRARDDPEADGTLERMATKWGIYPDAPLNVLLYSCNFTEVDDSNRSEWIVTYTVKNYQQYPCNYTVSLIVEYGNNVTKTLPMGEGMVKATWSEYAKDTIVQTVNVGSDMRKMYLIVESERADN